MKKYLGVLFAVLLTVACLVVPASAADYPVFEVDSLVASRDLISDTGWDYAMGYAFNQYRLWVWPKGTGRLRLIEDGRQISLGSVSDDCKASFWTSSGDSWVYGATFPIKNGSGTAFFGGNDSSIVMYESTVDIYDLSGNLFFQAPPPPQPGLGETVEELTSIQGTALLQKVSGAMKILVPFGVGCLALLTALPVLRKVLGRFLPV